MIRVGILARTRQEGEEVAAALAAEERLHVVGLATSTSERARANECDVLLAIGRKDAARSADGIPVVLCTDGAVDDFPALNGIHAVLPLRVRSEEMIAAVIAAASGLYIVTAEQMTRVSRGASSFGASDSVREKLTSRELEVLRMLADGASNKEIAQGLHISDHTAKFHVSQILAKLRAESRTEAVMAGVRLGLVTI